MQLSNILKIFLRPRGKLSFIFRAKRLKKIRILDVGCGNNSWIDFASLYPCCSYFGLDIQSYGTTNSGFGKNVIIKREMFNKYLSEQAYSFDAIVCSHNLEHCDDYKLTFSLLKKALVSDGIIYISFPTKSSVDFPKRSGALNYYADETHIEHPPDFDYICKELSSDNFEILYSSRRYRPPLLFILGLFQEPISFLLNKNLRFTWGFYGFESILWAKKNAK
jgi:SAM-dependent methyltransferase